MQRELQDVIAKLWEDSRPRMTPRVDTLAAAAEDPGDDALRDRALVDAHTLIGTLGSFGQAEASLAARAAEQALQRRDPAALAEAVAALRAAF